MGEYKYDTRDNERKRTRSNSKLTGRILISGRIFEEEGNINLTVKLLYWNTHLHKFTVTRTHPHERTRTYFHHRLSRIVPSYRVRSWPPIHLHYVPRRSPPGILYKVDSTQWDPLYQCIVALYSRYSDLSSTSSSSSVDSSVSSIFSPSVSLFGEVKRKPAEVITQRIRAYDVRSTDHWLQCDQCNKWRKVTAQVALKHETASWECGLNHNFAYASCNAPEEPDGDAHLAPRADAKRRKVVDMHRDEDDEGGSEGGSVQKGHSQRDRLPARVRTEYIVAAATLHTQQPRTQSWQPHALLTHLLFRYLLPDGGYKHRTRRSRDSPGPPPALLLPPPLSPFPFA